MNRSVVPMLIAVLLTACAKKLPPANTLPVELEEYRPAIDAAKLEYLRIEARRAQDEAPRASKFRGLPYRPKGTPWPMGRDGQPLHLLAQINFADTPPLAGYPSTGILQFFVSGEGATHIWGMNLYEEKPFDQQRYFQSLQDQAYFRVLWYAEVMADEQLEMTLPALPQVSLPIMDEAALRFVTDTEYVTPWDYRFERVFGKDPRKLFGTFGPRETEIANQYIRFSHRKTLAKIGGYAAFVQEDPRNARPSEDWLVLLEMRSGAEGGVEVLWGDNGVGAFLIRSEDLARRDFSRVAYYWDNH